MWKKVFVAGCTELWKLFMCYAGDRRVTKLPAMSSDVGSIIATFELAGVRRVIFGQRVISPDRKCLAMLQTVVLAKFLDAAALKEDLASHSLDVEFHPRGAAVGVFSQEQLEEYAGSQASQKTGDSHCNLLLRRSDPCVY